MPDLDGRLDRRFADLSCGLERRGTVTGGGLRIGEETDDIELL